MEYTEEGIKIYSVEFDGADFLTEYTSEKLP
jgi:hypothetical protein